MLFHSIIAAYVLQKKSLVLVVILHFNPFSNQNFSFIFQLTYAFQESGLIDIVNQTQVEVQHLNPTMGHQVARAKKFFGQLTKNTLQELFFKYRIDFELFDYALEPYLSYAKD